jgi:hypothetical protein
MSASKGSTAADAARQRRARLQLLGVAAVFLLPLLLAAVLHYSGVSSGKQRNAGELLQPPRALAVTGLQGLDGAAVAADVFKSRWNLLHWQTGDCDAACGQALYLSRQVRAALGKDAGQIQRWLILTATAAAPDAGLLAQHGDLKLLRAVPGFDAAQLLWPGESAPAPGFVRVVDPLGLLMLREEIAAEPKGFIRDLERLIKTSWVQVK